MNNDNLIKDDYDEPVKELNFSKTINEYELEITIFQTLEEYNCNECEIEIIWPTHVEENYGEFLLYPGEPMAKEHRCEKHEIKEIRYVNENGEEIEVQNLIKD